MTEQDDLRKIKRCLLDTKTYAEMHQVPELGKTVQDALTTITLSNVSIDPPKLTRSDKELDFELVQKLTLPDFDHWKYTEAEYEVFIEHFFVACNLQLEQEKLRNFISRVRARYNPNPFHCFAHGFTVIHMMYCFIVGTELKQKLTASDKLVLLVSALCHDLDHPGLTNSYQANAHTELAIRYNDECPLESHHCATTFTILSDPTCNILSQLDAQEFQKVRRGIIDCILATDMAKQPYILARVDQVASQFDMNNPEHRALLLVVLMKSSDISLECRPFDIAQTWLKRLFDEFFAQAKLEQKMGLPVLPHMAIDPSGIPKAQTGFIEHVLLPLYTRLAALVPEVEQMFLPRIRESLEKYKQLADQAETKPSASE